MKYVQLHFNDHIPYQDVEVKYLTRTGSGCNRCCTNLIKPKDHSIFRMTVSLDYFTNVQDKDGHVYVIAVYEDDEKELDIGHLSLTYLKCIDQHILQSIM